jgi:fluoride exporter
LDRYIMVMLGGAAGCLARYAVGTAIMTRLGPRFPWGTFVINVSGSFLIGVLMTLFTDRLHADPNWRLVLVVGFLGGYTTFSSFEWETFSLVTGGSWLLAALNAAGSVMFGYAAVWLGAVLAAKR